MKNQQKKKAAREKSHTGPKKIRIAVRKDKKIVIALKSFEKYPMLGGPGFSMI